MFESSTWQDRLSSSTLKITTATIFNTVRMGSIQERSKLLSTVIDCTAMTSWPREMPTAKVLWCVLATSIMAARQVKTSPRKTSIMTTYRSAHDALAQSSEAPWKRDNLYKKMYCSKMYLEMPVRCEPPAQALP